VFERGLKKFGGRKKKGQKIKKIQLAVVVFVEKRFAPFFHERSSRPSQWKLDRSVACEG
jgi:hypothetical protein